MLLNSKGVLIRTSAYLVQRSALAGPRVTVFIPTASQESQSTNNARSRPIRMTLCGHPLLGLRSLAALDLLNLQLDDSGRIEQSASSSGASNPVLNQKGCLTA